MKLKLVIFLFLVCTGRTFAQHICCAKTSTAQFAAIAGDKMFKESHATPLPFTFQSEKGKFVNFQTPDGKDARAYEVKGNGGKVILLFHEWWGLNDYIQQEAVRLQKELGEVTVLAVDLYDGKVTSDPAEASKLVQQLRDARARNIIKGAFDYIGSTKRIGTIGWCFGGGWSLQAAIMGGKQVDACVMYYGMPEKDLSKLKELKSPVLAIFGRQDKHITPQLAEEFEKNMKEAGKNLTLNFYDADHAFANPSNPKFNKEAKEDAEKLVISFFRKNLLK